MGDEAGRLAFLRLQLEQGPARYRADYADTLFEALLQGPWSAEKEDEAFGLLAKLAEAHAGPDALVAQALALQRLTDAMVRLRFHTLMKQVPSQSELTRTELRTRQLEYLKQARTQYAARLKEHMRDAAEPLALRRWGLRRWGHGSARSGSTCRCWWVAI